MIAAVVLRLPIAARPAAIPVLAKLVIKGTSSSSRLWLGRRVAQAIAAARLPGHRHHLVRHRRAPPADVASHRARAPRYTTKSQPSTADMLTRLRRVLIAAKYRASRPDQPTPEEINIIRLAREDAAA